MKKTIDKLIPVFTANIGAKPISACSAKALFDYVESDYPFGFKHWINSHIKKHKLVHNRDFIFISNSKDVDLHLSLPSAIDVVQKIERGQEICCYFIEVETKKKRTSNAIA